MRQGLNSWIQCAEQGANMRQAGFMLRNSSLKKAVNGQVGQLSEALVTAQFSGPGYIEVDIDVNAFKSGSVFTKIAKPIIQMVQPQVQKLVLDLGISLHGAYAEELPERLIGAVRQHFVALHKAKLPSKTLRNSLSLSNAKLLRGASSKSARPSMADPTLRSSRDSSADPGAA